MSARDRHVSARRRCAGADARSARAAVRRELSNSRFRAIDNRNRRTDARLHRSRACASGEGAFAIEAKRHVRIHGRRHGGDAVCADNRDVVQRHVGVVAQHELHRQTRLSRNRQRRVRLDQNRVAIIEPARAAAVCDIHAVDFHARIGRISRCAALACHRRLEETPVGVEDVVARRDGQENISVLVREDVVRAIAAKSGDCDLFAFLPATRHGQGMQIVVSVRWIRQRRALSKAAARHRHRIHRGRASAVSLVRSRVADIAAQSVGTLLRRDRTAADLNRRHLGRRIARSTVRHARADAGRLCTTVCRHIAA